MKTIASPSQCAPDNFYSKHFENVYDKYAGSINGLILRSVQGNAALANEITSRVFVKIFQQMKVGKLDNSISFHRILPVIIAILKEHDIVFCNPMACNGAHEKRKAGNLGNMFWAILSTNLFLSFVEIRK